MRRWLFRFFGFSSLAATILSAVIDLIVSSDRAETIFRPLGALWLQVHEHSLQTLHTMLTSDGPSWLWSGVLLPILSQPSIVVFGCLALLFLALALLMPRRDRRGEYDHRGSQGRRERPDDDDPRYDRRRH